MIEAFFGVTIVAGIAAVGLYGWSHNRLVALDQRCETALADIDVQLKHRHSLLPGLIETVRGFVSHERGILESVISARTAALQVATPDRLFAEKKLSETIGALLQIADRNPDLKASPHFTQLRLDIIDVENRIMASRRFLNLAVEEFNTALRSFPGNVIAGRMRLSARKPFDVGLERLALDEAVVVKF